MQKIATTLILTAAFALSAGCAQLLPSSSPFFPGAPTASQPLQASNQLAANASVDSCEILGQVTANAECACYDKMSYDQLRGQVTSNARALAKSRYPDSDMVQVLDVDLYLNNAIAHGVAYKCAPSRS